MKKIVTHNSVFHADEITAIALLKVFKPDDYQILRMAHQLYKTRNINADFFIDYGREYNIDQGKFDHHQWKEGKSSAGLIWDYIGVQKKFPKISRLVKKVDDHDVGIAQAEEFEFSSLIGSFNQTDIYSKEQDKAFFKALDIVQRIIENLVREQQSDDATKMICDNIKKYKDFDNVIKLPKGVPGWNKFINGETRPDIHAVVWYDEPTDTWRIQTTPIKPNSFEKVGKEFPINTKIPMEFVHSAGFFAIANDENILIEFIEEWNKLKD